MAFTGSSAHSTSNQTATFRRSSQGVNATPETVARRKAASGPSISSGSTARRRPDLRARVLLSAGSQAGSHGCCRAIRAGLAPLLAREGWPQPSCEWRPRVCGIVVLRLRLIHNAFVHDDQIDITHEQVVALVKDQLPHLTGLDVDEANGAGTVNAIYRIGHAVAARFPLQGLDARVLTTKLRAEMFAANELSRVCPFSTPEPLHLGEPGHGYPLPWTAQTWLPGNVATPTSCENSTLLAQDLGRLIGGLRRCDTRGRRYRGRGRGGELADHDDWMEECIRQNASLFDIDLMRSAWAAFRELPREDPDAMCHADLIPANLLVDDGRLVGVLDTGGFRPADPALDLVCAWHLLADGPREQLRTALGCGDLQWERGRAWAFQQASSLPWYYRDTNPAMAELGSTTLKRLLTRA